MKPSMDMLVLLGMLTVLINGCSGSKPEFRPGDEARLAACGDRPNCVSSETRDTKHRIDPFRLKGDPVSGWDAVRRVVGGLPRTTIVKATDRYLHAECKSRLFGFVDDLELLLDPGTGLIAIRSASRFGYSDLGVNRLRAEALRGKLMTEGLLF